MPVVSGVKLSERPQLKVVALVPKSGGTLALTKDFCGLGTWQQWESSGFRPRAEFRNLNIQKL
jgi:hypothetical protein